MTASPWAVHDVSREYSCDVSPPPGGDTSSLQAPDVSVRPGPDRSCAWCRGGLEATSRRDSVYCSQRCRQAAWRFGRAVMVATDAAEPKRLAYADPPYPGLSRRYYSGHPDYAGEVDHAALLSALQEYDGWALSTSADALPMVVSLLAGVDGWRVAAWFRGSRPTVSRGPLSAWEPVVVSSSRRESSRRPGDDALVYTCRPRLTDPDRVVGAKPAAFCSWLFGLLGARLGDTLADLFPGSGGVRRAWDLFQDPSRRTSADPSHLEPGDASLLEPGDASPPGADDASLEVLADGCSP